MTATVTNNVYVAHLADTALPTAQPTAVVWRSVGGRVLKTVTAPTAAALAHLCTQHPLTCLLAYGAGTGSSSSSGSGTATAGSGTGAPAAKP